MKRTALTAAAATALLLALSGCVSVETSESRIDVTPGASGTYSDGDTTVVVEPLTAETPDAAATDAAGTPDAAFLGQVREALPDDTTIPNATDAQLLAAGAEACSQMAEGVDFSAVKVIEGEKANDLGVHPDSALIAAVARKILCS